MGSPYTELYLHLVWTTWERRPLITRELQPMVYSTLRVQASRLRAEPVAIGGIEDHVHVLVRFPATISVSRLVGQLKGASSHMVTHGRGFTGFFKWQRSYGAFTVSKSGLGNVATYIRNQHEHHRSGRLSSVLERTELPD